MSADILWDVVGLTTATDIISCHVINNNRKLAKAGGSRNTAHKGRTQQIVR
jgi:hypothetical protein